MAITNVALVGNQGLGSTCRVEFLNLIDLDLDASYPDGGYTAFGTTVKAVIGTAKTIMGIVQMTHGGGYQCFYDRAADKLRVFRAPGALAPLVECTAATDLAAITNVEFLVLSK